MSFIVNAFQIPNALIDTEILSSMTHNELKCYLVVVRKTAGWNKEWDHIPTTQLMILTGIKKKETIYKSMQKLLDLDLLEAKKTPGKTTKYRLKVVPTNGTSTSTDNSDHLVPINGTSTSTDERDPSKDNTKTTKQRGLSLPHDTHYDSLSAEYKSKLFAQILLIDGGDNYDVFIQSLQSKSSYKFKNFVMVYRKWYKRLAKDDVLGDEIIMGDVSYCKVRYSGEVYAINADTLKILKSGS